MNLTWQPSENWTESNGSIVRGCIKLDYNSTSNQYEPSMTNQTYINLTTDSISGNIGGHDIDLYLRNFTANNRTIDLNMRIQSDGSISTPFGYYPMLTINDSLHNVTMHLGIDINNSDSIVAEDILSRNEIIFHTFIIKNLNISNPLENIELTPFFSTNENIKTYFHGKNLPFYIKTNSPLRLTSNGIKIADATALYIQDNNSISNDSIFSNPTGDFNVTINENGLQTERAIHFAQVSNLQTHFPYTTMSQPSEFDVDIVNGLINYSNINKSAKGEYRFKYSSKCSKGIECSNKGDSTISYNLESDNLTLSKDGAFTNHVKIENRVAWGSSKIDGYLLKYIFERKNDKYLLTLYCYLSLYFLVE